jgi:hypothetical protein
MLTCLEIGAMGVQKINGLYLPVLGRPHGGRKAASEKTPTKL